MKVLLISTRPFGATDIDRVLLAGLSPSAVDVCPSVTLAFTRLDAFPPDLVVVNLREPDAAEAVGRLRARGVSVPIVVVAPTASASDDVAGQATGVQQVAHQGGSAVTTLGGADVLTREMPAAADAALGEGREDRDHAGRTGLGDALDHETRWLLYEVASIGHVSTTPDGDILASNDIAAQLLGHFSPDALEAAGRMPAPLLQAAGPYAQRPSRFELCLQHGEDGPLHWIVGLALPQGGHPATVTWFLIDVSEQRLQARRARFLRRMDALTHVLSAATAECATLVDTGGRALAQARTQLPDDIDVDQAVQALSRTQAVLTQLAGFARRRARRPSLRDLRAVMEQVTPVLVHAAGDEVDWTMDSSEEPLHASIDPAELEQCLAAIATLAREALPLGGQVALSLRGRLESGAIEEGRGARPEIEIALVLRGYGLQPVVVPAHVETLAVRLGAQLVVEQPDHLTSRLVLALPRVFVTT